MRNTLPAPQAESSIHGSAADGRARSVVGGLSTRFGRAGKPDRESEDADFGERYVETSRLKRL